MSGEQLTAKDLNKTPIARSSKRVDINNLLSKVREEKNKEKKENLYFCWFNLWSSCGYWYYSLILIV